MYQDAFPINYFKSLVTPVRAFLNRKQLSWPKILFVLLFLNGLMIIPITLNYATQEIFTLDGTFPTVMELVTDEVADELQDSTYSEGVVTFHNDFEITTSVGIVAGGDISYEEYDNYVNALLFTPTEIILKEYDLPINRIPYINDTDWSKISTEEEVRNEISRQWYVANRTYMVATFSLLIAAILFSMNLLLVFGSALFVYLAMKSGLSESSTYKNSVNLVLNAIGIPVILSLLAGLFLPDITLMMGIQTFGLVLMLILMYYRTRFSDHFSLKENKPS